MRFVAGARIGSGVVSAALTAVACGAVPVLFAQQPARSLPPATVVAVPRTPDGHPDFQGLWTNGTATPLLRPQEFANKPTLTPEEAAAFEKGSLGRLLEDIPEADRVTAADLNDIYLDTHSLKLVDGRRTSLIVDPPDGRLPLPLPQAKSRSAARPKRSFDDPETLTLDERCLLSTVDGTSNASPPMVPNQYAQNFYEIVQTRGQLMIYTEVVHDARVIRIGGTHPPPTVQFWLGDSVGHWEGDTLVVDTTNFTPKSHFRGSSERLHVVERFTRPDANTIGYRATVDDPDTWARSWTADIPFKRSTDRIFEYACHEGNYSLENGMRGARAEEKEKAAHKTGGR